MKLAFATAAALALVMAGNAALADPPTAVQEKLAAKKAGPMKKIGPALEGLYKTAPRQAAKAAPQAAVTRDGYAVVETAADLDAIDALKADLAALGAKNISSFGHMVSALVPVESLDGLAQSEALQFARPVLAERNVGLVDSQGDVTMRTDEARATFGVDGTGIRFGILSDSFSCVPNPLTTTEEDIANGDLPADIIILEDIASGCIDEGRGMAQLMYDVAPGSSFAYHTAFLGQPDFANGILELAYEAGSDVIVDDIIYFSEPMFQDGVIAQAADIVNGWGIPYYSSAGNRARESYEAEYRPVPADNGGVAGTWHDFDESAAVDTLQDFTVFTGGFGQVTLTFQWDEPYFSVSGAPGASNDVDALFFDPDGNLLLDCFDDFDPVAFPPTGGFPPLCQFGTVQNIGGDPIELVSVVTFVGSRTFQLGFFTADGDAPGRVKYVKFDRTGTGVISEFDVEAPSSYGHNNAAGAEAVGAAFWQYTEEFEATNTTFVGGDCVPACLEGFSSAGGTPILFDLEGNRLAEPDIRVKPGITGPDGGNTTFFGGDTVRDPDTFPNFFGTSASAPHVAAAAGLMLDLLDEEVAHPVPSAKPLYRMCVPTGNKLTSRIVPADQVLGKLLAGARFRACDAIQPAEVREVFRSTAQDMTERVSFVNFARNPDGSIILDPNNVAADVTVFIEEVADPEGFDFDTGFGMIDAVEALGAVADQAPKNEGIGIGSN